MGRSINFIQQVYLAWRMMILLGIVLGVSASLMGQSSPLPRSTSNRTVSGGAARNVASVSIIRSERAAAADSLKSEKEKEKEEALKQEESQKARKVALKAWRERLKRPVNGFVFEPDSLGARPDSFAILRFTKGVRFLDSLKGGKLDSVSAQISRIDYGRKLKYNYRDPFDPYNNQVFYRPTGRPRAFRLALALLKGMHWRSYVTPSQAAEEDTRKHLSRSQRLRR